MSPHASVFAVGPGPDTTATATAHFPVFGRTGQHARIASPLRRRHPRRSCNDGCTAHPPKCAQKCAQTRASSRVLLRKACDEFREYEFVNNGIRQYGHMFRNVFSDIFALFVLTSANLFCCNGIAEYNRSRPRCSKKCAQQCAQKGAFPW